MSKTKSAGKAEAEEKSDGLEIISIGSLYSGPWDKKYWSCSRGKDRYPYPVGYSAVRAHNGISYKMEISEGVNGPTFVISSGDGNSFSGKTPDIAWEEFQKGGCPRMKIWHGKRLSSKMDGLELFGFKNPFVLRLLRELVADTNAIAGQSLVSSKICDGISRIQHDDCDQVLGTYPDLLVCLERPQVTGKRSRRCETKRIKLQGGTILKRPRALELSFNSVASDVKDMRSLNQGSSADIANNLSTEEETPHRSEDAELKVSNLFVTRKNSKPTTSVLNESEGRSEILLYAPDTLDFIQEDAVDSAPNSLDKNAHSERAYDSNCGKLSSQADQKEEAFTSYLNPSFGKSDLDSGGQEVAKSMMTLLLPQAIPLLKEDSTNKDFVLSPSKALPATVNSMEDDNGTGKFLDVTSSDTVGTKKSYMGREEKIHMPNTDVSSEQLKIIVPDSFEYDQCEDHETKQVILSSDIAEPGGANINNETCSPRSQEHLSGGVLPNKSSMCHTDINLTEDKFCHDPQMNSKEWPLDSDVCIPDSCVDHMSPIDRITSENNNNVCMNSKEKPVQDGENSMQKDMKTEPDFTEETSNAHTVVSTNDVNLRGKESLAKLTQDETVDETGNRDTMIMPSSQVQKLVYTRRKVRIAAPQTGNYPLSECTGFYKFGEHINPEKHTANDTLARSKTIQTYTSEDKPSELDLLAGKARDEAQADSLYRENSSTIPQTNLKPTISESKSLLCTTKDKFYACPDISDSLVETSQAHGDMQDGQSNLDKSNCSLLSENLNPNSCGTENICTGVEQVHLVSEPETERNKELNNNVGSIVKLVGRYCHPMPVSSLLLHTSGNEIHICVLCGNAVDQDRTLYTYKVTTKEPSIGCPSFIAYTSILLPDPKYNFIREIVVERSGVQFTTDGQHIVLLGSIKTPNCREGKMCCDCSTCTSLCSDMNAVKIVRIEHGYVSVIATLETVEYVHCILVCEPNQIVSVGESGRLQLWVMNSTWREKIEDFTLPSDDSLSPAVVELKRVPKCSHLVVGRNCFGEFSLWDISKRTCVSSFSASTHPINQFHPICLFHWKTRDPEFSYASLEEQADELLGATNLWFSEHRKTRPILPSEEEDIAMWLLVSASSSYCQIDKDSSWRLALLAKNIMILGSPLDPRTTAIGILGGHGIIGTYDGFVYMWELASGSKLRHLHHFQDGSVTCVATDDSRGCALGVAGDGGKLLIYLCHDELHEL